MCTNFIDCSETDQAKEIREFLSSLGADIPVTDDPSQLSDITKASHVVWEKVDSSTEAEGVINSVISLLLLLPEKKLKLNIEEFCDTVVKDATASNRALLCLKILTGFFHALSEESDLRYSVYMAMLKCSRLTRQLHMVCTDLATLKQWRGFWKISLSQWQDLLRLLHETLLTCSDVNQQGGGELAAGKAMYELLSSYDQDTVDNAPKEDAIRCISAELKNPNVYLFDHLLNLEPVKALKGQNPIHELLEVFVSGTLDDYLSFEKKQNSFLTEKEFDTSELTRKIRLLTFVSMAAENKEIEFSTLSSRLQIPDDEIEEFVIEAVRSRVLKARIDQLANKVVVTSASQRTFSTNEWKSLFKTLIKWKTNIDGVSKQIASVSMDLSNPL